MRFLADIHDEDVKALDLLAQEQGKSRAAILREAVDEFLHNRAGNDWIERGAGYWKDRDNIGDSVNYQRDRRAERPRPFNV